MYVIFYKGNVDAERWLKGLEHVGFIIVIIIFFKHHDLHISHGVFVIDINIPTPFPHQCNLPSTIISILPTTSHPASLAEKKIIYFVFCVVTKLLIEL